MESFFRYTAYVDYYKEEEKIRNVGFLRWKLHKNMHLLELQVKEVDCFRGNYEIMEKNTGKVVGELLIDKGIGTFNREFPAMAENGERYLDINGGKLYLCDVEGFIIHLNKNETLNVDVKLKKYLGEEENKIEKKEIRTEFEMEPKGKQNKKEIEIASENILIEGISDKYEERIHKGQIEEDCYKHKKDYADSAPKKTMKIMEPLHEDKWQQLCKEYPKVQPFQGKSTFLSIKPKDFIILQQEYQKLVHNSFLLHGFYNYGHMVLGKLTEEKEAPVYIGVPGVYYEREKQAARMFGFVGFESTKQPVQSGSYGYYMIEVKI